MTLALFAVAIFLVVFFGARVVKRRRTPAICRVMREPAPPLPPQRKLTWKDTGGARGRATRRRDEPNGHATAAEPEATLDIKVIRADGRIEHYHVPAMATKGDN
jgi:hypothetical protein